MYKLQLCVNCSLHWFVGELLATVHTAVCSTSNQSAIHDLHTVCSLHWFVCELFATPLPSLATSALRLADLRFKHLYHQVAIPS